MPQLTLYTTLGCHLCERLEALLAVLHHGEYGLEKVEISESEALMERYGVRIPVLADAAGEELDLGFEAPRLAAWLEARERLDATAWKRLERGETLSQAPRQESLGKESTSRERPAGRRYLA